MILTFFLAYKLTDYAANFSTIKKESRIEIIFLTIFFIFLFVPMIHINQDKIAVNENRYLTDWKPLITKSGAINFNFGKDYNSWFNDRFNLRHFFTDLHTNITLLLTRKAKKGIIDKNGFVYMDFEFNHFYLSKINKQDYDALIKFDKYCKDRNIELYILIVPCKGYVYPPTEKYLINDNYYKLIDKQVNRLKKDYNMHIIYLYKKLAEAAKNNYYLYYKTDHHWTNDGAFIGYQEIMKEITKQHPEIKILKQEDFDISYNTKFRSGWEREFRWGQSTTRTNMPLIYKEKLHNVNYRYYDHKNSELLQTEVIHIPYKRVKYYHYPKGADYRVILLGTSFNEALCEFIPFTFKNVFRVINNSIKKVPIQDEFKIIKYHEKRMLDYHPDIIIFCIVDYNIVHLRDMFKME